MENIKKAIHQLNLTMSEEEKKYPVSFEELLKMLSKKPSKIMRNVFQVFSEMVTTFVGEGTDEYPDDPESINFKDFDCDRLFVEGSDNPFFADRLLANRFVNLTDSFKRGAQQNKIYIFEGSPGSGKSTFLNNLLRKFEEYSNTEEGYRYETVWRLDKKTLGMKNDRVSEKSFDKVITLLSMCEKEDDDEEDYSTYLKDDFIEVPCPSHDHPILMIPKKHRRAFFDELLENDEFKWKLFTEKEHEWVFRQNPCTICSSLYEALLSRLKSPLKVFEMIYVRPYVFNRRLGEGISVFNPGDRPMKQTTQTNPMLQKRINSLLKDSNRVKYLFSNYARTNNGIFALMDIKNHNKERLIELHNIISEGLHKVEDIEENVNSLFLALMNPEDKTEIQRMQSFLDRIQYVNIAYVLDWQTEVQIYFNIFGKHIEEGFLPRVLFNFARVILSSRLNTRSEALLEWIEDPKKYNLYCDENLQLLKMEIYTGAIPKWLSEEDRKKFTEKRRRKIIAEAETEGKKGFSGRDSIQIFSEFYSTYAKEDELINMNMLYNYFTTFRKDLNVSIPKGFLDSLIQMYNYTILQEVKESLYSYNEDQIAADLQNYLFAINFEIGSVETCSYTGDKIEITDEYLDGIELRILGATIDKQKRLVFRKDIQKEYTTRTLTQEIFVEDKNITETDLYGDLHGRYVYNIKEKVLDPFLKNENFRRAIKDYDTDDFKAYDKRIQGDVTFLIKNLCEKYKYTEKGAKEVCIYVIDNDLARKFGDA